MYSGKIKRKILVSVDDGSKEDLTVADLLLKYKIPGVFYIPVNVCDFEERHIKKIAGLGNCPWCKKAKGLFEIGSHTLTHPSDMKKLSDEQLYKEVVESKNKLESIIGKEVTKFCYPRGRHDERVRKAIKDAGYKEARTTIVLCNDFPIDPYMTNTSAHVCPIRKEYRGIPWTNWASRLFNEVIKEGGRFELWLHGWEALGRYNELDNLQNFLKYMDEEMEKISYSRRI